MNAEEALAREAIRRTVEIYNRAVDEGRYEKLELVFAENGVLQIQDREPLIGRAAIITALKGAAERRKAVQAGNFQRHNMTSAMIEVLDGDRAKALHYILVITELGFDHAGSYEDEYRREGDHWLIVNRSARMEWARPDSRFVKWLGHASPRP